MDSWDTSSSSYDSSDFSDSESDQNSMLEEIMRLKEKRLRLLDQFSSEQEQGLMSLLRQAQDRVKEQKKRPVLRGKRKAGKTKRAPSRRSERIKTQVVVKDCGYSFNFKNERKAPVKARKLQHRKEKVREKPINKYGPTPGIEIGHQWNTRLECSHDGVHRPTIAGIHPGPLGAYSIALSGGYAEDVDEGDTVIFTGAGGRDLKGIMGRSRNVRSAPQIKDQELNGANLSLVKSLETGLPVRVIRGSKLGGCFAPDFGYRYDGLYRVVQYCYTSGYSGYRIFRFRMSRLERQKPAPWKTWDPSTRTTPPPPVKRPKIERNPLFQFGSELDREIEICIRRLTDESPSRYKVDDPRPFSAFRGWNIS